MRKIGALISLLLLFASLSLMAVNGEASAGLGMRMSTIDDPAPVFAVTGRIEEYSLHLEARGRTALLVSLSAHFEPVSTMVVDLCLYNGFRYDEGNYHLLSASLGQEFNPGLFTLSYEAGIQTGINIPQGGKPQFTFSPLLRFEAGVKLFETLSLGLVLSGGNEREASLQSTPLVSPYISFDTECFFARLDADFRYANFSSDRPFPLQSFMVLFSAGYRWRQ